MNLEYVWGALSFVLGFAMEIYKSSNFYKSCCNYYQPTSNNPNSAIGPIDRLILLLHRNTSPLLLFKLSSFSYAPWTSLSVRTSWPRDNHVSCFRSADRTKKTTRRQMSPSRSKRNRMPSAIVSAYLLTGGTVRIRLAEPISESRLLLSRRKCKCRLLRFSIATGRRPPCSFFNEFANVSRLNGYSTVLLRD